MIAQKILSKCPPIKSIFRTQHRHVRGMRKEFRQSLPRYKNALMNLRDIEQTGDDGRKSLAELWTERVDFYKSYMPMNQQYILLEALFNPSSNIDQLLRIIDESLPTMNSFYMATAFEVLDDMIKMNLTLSDTVLVSPEFENLCRRSLIKLRFFEADEILKVIKCLSSVKMPEDTLIAQSALQMTRHLINDFNLRELETLKASLDKLNIIDNTKKSLLSAVKQAASIRITKEYSKQQERLAMEENKQIDANK